MTAPPLPGQQATRLPSRPYHSRGLPRLRRQPRTARPGRCQSCPSMWRCRCRSRRAAGGLGPGCAEQHQGGGHRVQGSRHGSHQGGQHQGSRQGSRRWKIVKGWHKGSHQAANKRVRRDGHKGHTSGGLRVTYGVAPGVHQGVNRLTPGGPGVTSRVTLGGFILGSHQGGQGSHQPHPHLMVTQYAVNRMRYTM